MKPFALLTLLLTLAAASLDSRADDTNAAPPAIGSAQAADWIGKQAVVTGLVAQVSFRPTMTFLNFDKRYPSNLFTAVIRSRNTKEFENLPALRGKPVAVKGQIKDYQGRPEMELTRKSQLEVLGDKK
jgi:DNA/RNA endonuclease YhcR with UshA esterase domain